MKKSPVLAAVKAVFLDMDGTIYLDNELFDGTLDFLDEVKKTGGKYLFVTNNSSKSVDKDIEKLTTAENKEAVELVHSIDEMANDSVNIEATILRMNEILSALYECNKAYINAYVKIRDELFPEPTFINFIKQIGKKKANFSKISAADLGYLIEVTKYYNKINTSEV